MSQTLGETDTWRQKAGSARKYEQGLRWNGHGRGLRTVVSGLAVAKGGGRDKWGRVKSDHRRPQTPGRHV